MDGLLTDPELGRRLSLTGAGFDQPSRRVLISAPSMNGLISPSVTIVRLIA